ncbi:uncharacterized protein LOC122505974 [Leptopilina heterotoma]|uniref:uncharacterized protein LOC122505974 n=1 Tax=Leptopilina heterotoma TaxID=63436 RepID=UPI001CA9AAB6|nr:uncharacterized protein LOC122505974 [Leptopilina heterotoma]
MEVLIDCYFDKLFSEMERSSLASRHKRRQLVKYFSDVIESCYQAENIDKHDVCERIVQAGLRYHNIAMMENGSVCLLGKFHNVLYVIGKLCFDWKLSNNEIVSRLLNDIFYCEGTFERIFVGAIFGIRVTHFLSGWKSDYEDRDENINALMYFLDHATVAKLEYRCASSLLKRRFIDVPMESYGQVLPLRVAVQSGSPDILEIMLRYGASTEGDALAPAPIEILLSNLDDYQLMSKEMKQMKPIYPENLITCLRILLRTIPMITVKTPSHVANQSGVMHLTFYEQYPKLVESNLVPAERSGVVPPELKHLARCRIRSVLHQTWQLPHGIRKLDIPTSLMDYLDLQTD